MAWIADEPPALDRRQSAFATDGGAVSQLAHMPSLLLNDSLPERPGPRGRRFDGPWLQQQILLSLAVGLASVILFGMWKRAYPSLYMARYREQGSALPYRRIRNGIVSWILPTLLYSDHSLRHTAGLDAAVALLFLKMGFAYMTLASLWSILVVMPVNYYSNGWIDGVKRGEVPNDTSTFLGTTPATPLDTVLKAASKRTPRDPLPFLPLPSIVTRDTLYENTQLVSTFLYSLLALYILWRTYTVFISFRQGHAGISQRAVTSRTVELRRLPEHLTTAEALASYFAEVRLTVESVIILQDTTEIDKLLVRRVRALHRLEAAWVSYVGCPADADEYDPETISTQTASMLTPARPGAPPIVGAQVRSLRPRPTHRMTWWNLRSPRIDTIDQLSYEFATLTAAVQEARDAPLKRMHTAFVTFKNAWSAQIASQVVTYPTPGYMLPKPAVEPRDVIWVNEEAGVWDRRLRQCIMTVLMGLVLTLTLSLDVMLARLVNMSEIKVYFPQLGDLLDENIRVRAFVQKSLPTLLLILINALVPVAMRASTYFQRIPSRSRIEHSVLAKYYLYLLFSVVFVFLFTNARDMLKELSQSPMHMIDKLAQSLPVARQFSLSYVVFQGLAIQPLQLLLLPSIFLSWFHRFISSPTPRERMHRRPTPTMDIGTLYPQALLVFTLCVLYSIVSPLILVFGAVYFGIAYTVLKYQLLNVLDKPYDSHGDAWPLAVNRCLWALVLFEVFQLSLFSVRKQVINSLLIVPLIGYTVWFATTLMSTFMPLTRYINMYDLYVAYDETEAPPNDSDLSAYPVNYSGETPYEPPIAWNHPGLLTVGRSSYGQPALTARLPSLWLPRPMSS